MTFFKAVLLASYGAQWQRREQLARLAVHVEIASRINKAIEERALVALGKLEQDLVFGDATSKEVIAFLAAHGATPAREKVRTSA